MCAAVSNVVLDMRVQVPVAELDGLGVELEKLSELESIKEEWQLQAEAQDEVSNQQLLLVQKTAEAAAVLPVMISLVNAHAKAF